MKQEEYDHSNVLLMYQFNNNNMAHILKTFYRGKLKKIQCWNAASFVSCHKNNHFVLTILETLNTIKMRDSWYGMCTIQF